MSGRPLMERADTVCAALMRRVQRWKASSWRLPLLRRVRCMFLRRTSAVYPDRTAGVQVVRYYWAQFLDERREDIRGRALEIGVTGTVRYYGEGRVNSAEAIDIAATGPDVTIVADLATADNVPSDQFDCFVNQFTIHIIYDFRAALYHSLRLLKPGGVLLINFPCRSGYPVGGIPLGDGHTASVYWWFTPRLVETVFEDLGIVGVNCQLKTYGNFFALTAYMAGIPSEELTRHELDAVDTDFPLLVCARIQKPIDWAPRYRPVHEREVVQMQAC